MTYNTRAMEAGKTSSYDLADRYIKSLNKLRKKLGINIHGNKTEDKMKKDEFEQIEKLVLQLREIEKALKQDGKDLCRYYALMGEEIIFVGKDVAEPALLMYAEKLKAELKELGYEDDPSSNP